MDSIKHLLHLITKSVKDLKKDIIYVKELRKNKKKSEFTIFEYIKQKQVLYDLVKFVPYSVFLSIPFLEVFLPVYMVLFPNALPSQFFTEKSMGQKNQIFLENQKIGFQILQKQIIEIFKEDYYMINNYSKTLDLQPENLKIKQKLFALDRKLLSKLDELIKSQEISFKKTNLKQKEAILKFFYVEYISG